MPALDIYEERPISVYNRMESFPPLFETEQPKKRTKTEPVTGFVKTAPKPKTGKLRKGLLAAALAVIIVFGAVAGVYVLIPQIKGSEEQPVVFLGADKLYVTRGSHEDESCLVMDLGDEFDLLKTDEEKARAAKALEESIYYDEAEQMLYFEDLSSDLFSVKLKRLRPGKDISDKVERVAQNVCSAGENEEILTSGITVLGKEDGVLYISGEDSSLCIAREGKKKVIAEDVELYTVSPEGKYVMYLCNNAAVSVHKQYTMYIRPIDSEKGLVKVDSRVSTVEHSEGEFDLLFYTRYDEENAEGPISVWVGGRNIEKEAVLENIYSCDGFSDEGFYYSVAEKKMMLCADYVKDIPEDDEDYAQYETVRDVLTRTTADAVLQTVYFWRENGAELISENVASWKLLENKLLGVTVCDYDEIEKIEIESLKSAYTVVEYLKNSEERGIKGYSYDLGSVFDAKNLKYECMDPESGKAYFINGEDNSLYSCVPTRDGFGQLSRIAGDVYAAAWWGEEERAVFVRDYNENTGLCDLYMETEDKISQISYNAMPYGSKPVVCGGKTLLYTVGSESAGAGEPAQLCIFEGGDSRIVADTVKSFAGADSERIFYICENEAGVDELYCSDAGKRPIHENVVFVCAPGAAQVLELSVEGSK